MDERGYCRKRVRITALRIQTDNVITERKVAGEKEKADVVVNKVCFMGSRESFRRKRKIRD